MISLCFITPDEMKARVKGRELYLWGASIVGCGICRALERNGISPAGFIDSSSRMQGTVALGYKVYRPDEILKKEPAQKSLPFIVITSGHYEHEIMAECEKNGFVKDRDFISARTLCPLDPSVDISGVCNLHCISCPRGNMRTQPPAGFITAATYARVLDKLLRELPFAGNIQLYAWGEPLLNPEVAQIIKTTVDRKLLCAISTNLNVRTDFADAIRAKPDWIKLSVSGYGGEHYEITHTGGKWAVLLSNMKKLSEYRRRFNPQMYVEVNYHLYKHNIGEEYDRMQALCNELGFVFRPNNAYLYSLDNIMKYREGGELTGEARQTLDMLLLDIDEGIARAEAQKHLPCAEERCFPINWNLNVRFCGAYFEPVVAGNYLETPLGEIVRRRNESPFCKRCMSLALHRFTGVYLEEKYINHEAAVA
jgi:MoaA/NifB/PqqE/SkfB family radical SAM enzyme